METSHQSTSVRSDSMLIPGHGHAVITIIKATNSTGAANSMIDYNVCHGFHVVLFDCVNQGPELTLTAIDSIKRVQVTRKITYRQRGDDSNPS